MQTIRRFLVIMTALLCLQTAYAQSDFTIGVGIGAGAGAARIDNSNSYVWAGLSLLTQGRVNLVELIPGINIGAFVHVNGSFGGGLNSQTSTVEGAFVLDFGVAATIGFKFPILGFTQEFYLGIGPGLTLVKGLQFSIQFVIGAQSMFSSGFGIFSNVLISVPSTAGGIGLVFKV